MRIIITGGTGLIGRALCEKWAADQHELIVLTRNAQRTPVMPETVQFVEWDAKTADGWGHHVDGADAVVNLAGAGIADARWTEERKNEIRQSRIDAGRAVVAAIQAAAQKPALLIQASAVGYYGSTQDDKIITEQAPPGADFLAQVCFDWETSTVAVESMGVRRVIIRTGIVLSNAGGAWPKMKLPFVAFAGGPLGSGDQWYPWIHIRDEVRAIDFLLQHDDATGPFNLSAPNPLPNKEFSKVVGKVMGRPAFMPAPGFALRTALGDMATVLLDGQRAIPQKLLDAGFTFDFSNAEDAIAALVQQQGAMQPQRVEHAA